MEQTTGHYIPPEPASEPAFIAGIAYGVLAVAGVLLGLIGSFEFSWELGSIPVAALALCLVNLAVFCGAGWGMQSRLGVVVPAALWLIVVLVLSSRRPEGDLVVTGTAAGYIYMFGGVVAALVAVTRIRPAQSRVPGGAPYGVRQ